MIVEHSVLRTEWIPPVTVMSPFPVAQLSVELLGRLVEAAGRWRLLWQDSLRAVGMDDSLAELLLQLELQRPAGWTQSALARALRRSESHLSNQVERLVQRSWCVRDHKTGDSRVHLLQLTVEGQQAAGRVRALRQRLATAHLSRLNACDQSAFSRLLGLIADSADSHRTVTHDREVA